MGHLIHLAGRYCTASAIGSICPLGPTDWTPICPPSAPRRLLTSTSLLKSMAESAQDYVLIPVVDVDDRRLSGRVAGCD